MSRPLKRMADGENFAESNTDDVDAEGAGPAQWTSGEISSLIAMVAQSNHLYNTENPDYSIRDEVESSWLHIAQTLGKTVRECRDKWYNLRTVYRRQLRATQAGRMKTPQRWVWRDAMSFLMPYLRIVPSNVQPIGSDNAAASPGANLRVGTVTESVLPQVKVERLVEYDAEQENSSDSPTPPKIYCLDDDFEDPMRKDSSMWESSSTCSEELFLRSLLPDMKTLSPRNKAIFKLKVQQALFECMFPDDGSDNRDNDA